MGFYTLIDDPQHTVHLLAYGSDHLSGTVLALRPTPAAQSSAGIKALMYSIPPAWPAWAITPCLDLRSPIPILPATATWNRSWKVQWSTFRPTIPTTLRLRSLALVLNLPYSEPGPQRYGQKDNMLFYIAKGDLGYHIPVVFDRFIASHGGMEISGKPLVDPFRDHL